MSELKGLKIKLSISDPWSFGTIHGCGPFPAEVLEDNVGANKRSECVILIRLDNPLTFDGENCEYFVATPRLENDDIANIKKGLLFHCNLTRIPEERAKSSNPFDLSWWWGGVSLIGDIATI